MEKQIGDFAPKLVELTDQVLFGDIWERPELSKRDRSMITCAALVANPSSVLRRMAQRHVGDRARQGTAGETSLGPSRLAASVDTPRALAAALARARGLGLHLLFGAPTVQLVIPLLRGRHLVAVLL
jgi:alkylhydroperoxidase/carboxymuconolactone decarboxylase family protein YurZ